MKTGFSFYILTAILVLTALAGGSRNRQPSETADERKADYLYLEALRCKALGKPDATFELLQRAYELKPSDVEIGAELASFVLSLSRGDSAEVDRGIRMWRDYVNFNPDDYISGVHYALLNERVGNRTEALGMWNRLHNRFPEKEELTFKYADVLGSTSDTASIRRAVEIYDSLEAVDGKSIALSSKKIQLFYQEADTPAIFSELKSLLASSPSSVEFNVFAGDIFTMFQNRDSALIFYNRACATDSTSGLAFYSRANYYNAIGDSAGYDREIFNALKKESLDVTTKLAMMKGYIEEMYSDSTEQPRIRELFEVLIDQHPHEHDIHDMFSRYLIVTRDYAGAAEQSELALDIEPDDKEGWQMLVSLYLQVQDYENAGKAAQRALRYFPSDPELHLMLGSIYAQLDKSADSRKEYEEALKLGDSSDVEFLSRLYTSMGDNFYIDGNKDSAFVYYERAILYNPENYTALNNCAYYLACEGRDLDKAMELITQVVAVHTDEPTSQDTYAWVLFKKKEYPEAKAAIDRAIELTDDPSSDIFEHAGDIYFMNGDPDGAVKFWEKALKLDPDNDLLKRKVRHKTYFYK